jgi:uncharacterized protein YsxB (DUF464 family)
LEVPFQPVIIIGGALSAIVYAIVLQLRAMRKQAEAVEMARDSIARQARSMETQERSVVLLEKILAELQEFNQKTPHAPRP